MEILQQLSIIVLGAIFLSVIGVLFIQYQEATAEHRFFSQLNDLAGVISGMGSRDIGSVEFFNIDVPSGWRVSFQTNSIFVRRNGETENIFVGIEVAGDEIFGGSFGLKVTRTENGVEVRIYG